MYDKKKLSELQQSSEAWENGTLKKDLQRVPEKEIGPPPQIPRKRLYTPLDVANLDYMSDIGFPGEYPFVRGAFASMYRGRPWSIAQYSGFGTPEDTNKLYKYLLAEGQDGLNMACDLPTQLGYDPDHAMSEGNVGVLGMSCPSLQEMERAFDGIPLDKVSMRSSTNAPHICFWAMYYVMAEKRGITLDKLTGSVFSDCLEEYISRGNYIFPPQHALRLSADVMEFCTKNVPKFNFMIHPYTIREGGSNLVEELAFGMACMIAVTEAALARGLDIDDFASRLTMNFSVHMNLFEEAAKFRAARKLWAKTMKERFGAKKATSMILRSGPGTGGCTLTAQQPENNIARVAIECLAAVLGGAQYIHTSSYDEGLAIPTQKAVTIAIRTQQIIAHESGVADVIDPLAGSYYFEYLTKTIEDEVNKYLQKIDDVGGIVKAVESGWAQQERVDAGYKYQREIEEGKRPIVGVNKFAGDEKVSFQIHRANSQAAEIMKARVLKLKRERDNAAVKKALAALQKAARGKENLMPATMEAVKNYATMGEVCSVFRTVFGEWRSPV